MSQVVLRRSGPRQLVGIDERNQTLTIDVSPDVGGEWAGLKPSELLPFSLGACIAVTAIGILEKMRQGPFELTVRIDFEHDDEPPKAFTRFRLEWLFHGSNLDPEKLQKAVDIAEERYCSVSASLKDDIVVEHIIKIES